MKAKEIAKINELTVEQLFEIPTPNSEKTVICLDEIGNCLANHSYSRDWGDLSWIRYAYYDKSTAKVVPSLSDNILTEMENAIESAAKWRKLALKLFNKLSIDEQAKILSHLPASTFRAGRIDEILEDLNQAD